MDRALPPDYSAIEAALLELVRQLQPIGCDDLDELVAGRCRIDCGDEDRMEMLHDVCDDLMVDDGPLAMVAGDLVVHRETLVASSVFTHRLNEAELSLGILTAPTVDLAAFRSRGPLRLPSGEKIERFSAEPGHLAWAGPADWLGDYAPDTLIAVIVVEGILRIAALHHEPVTDHALLSLVRKVYDDEIAEPGLPVSAEELVLGVLARKRDAFAAPELPLSEMCALVGLERRGAYVAHDDSIWDNRDEARRHWRLMDRLGTGPRLHRAYEALMTLEDAGAEAERLRAALQALDDLECLPVVTDELIGFDDDPDAADALAEVAERLIDAAQTGTESAVAHWLAAIAAERQAEPEFAERHLEAALGAAPDWEPAMDRLAWYRSDRGDARRAAGLWRALGVTAATNLDLAEVELFAKAGAAVGRNEPCPCGSGRKYKHCHQGQPPLPPLPERVGWLCRKAVAYLDRRGWETQRDVSALAESRALDPADDDELDSAYNDPIVIDAALHEGGWFARFLHERGQILPEDEQLLAAAWHLVARTVYEVKEARAGAGLTVQDLRTAETFEVRERTFSRHVQPGALVCGRAVPDGEGHQFVGSLFPVAAGIEATVLDLLDRGDPEELVSWVRDLHRPPRLTNREGDPLVSCRVEARVPDPDMARTFLDERFDADAEGWTERFEVEPGEIVTRAIITLDGSRLSLDTNSEERLERLLEALEAGLGGVDIDVDERVAPPMRTSSTGRRPPVDDPGLRAALEEYIGEREERWCDESVPALGGVTPREAAKDPTRRESLVRLIASFPEPDPASDAMGFRPSRLRHLLGIGDS